MTNSNDIPSPHDLMAPRDTTSERGTDSDAPPASPLDEARVASMADEGGVSGALMEIDDPTERKHLLKTHHGLRLRGWGKAAAAVALLGVGVVAVGWLRRNA
jgi:hypothetical protein